MPISDDELAARKKIPFEQAEGDPIPPQLQLGEMSQELRAYLWDAVYGSLIKAVKKGDWGNAFLDDPWFTILKDKHVLRDHALVDEFIRHSLLDKGSANVDQADAQYMLGACAAFVSYLLARSREIK